MAYTNSSLVSYTRISPNRNISREHSIDTITIHCTAGQLDLETLGNIFAPTSRKASSNYGISYDGKVGMYCEEKDRSWCSSSPSNDHRAITIEVSSDNFAPYKVKDAAYNTLIKLVADICKRNGIKKLVWSDDRLDRINHVNGCNMTVHRDFANTACPGDYLYGLMPKIATEVNKLLSTSVTTNTEKSVTAKKEADKYDTKLIGRYKTKKAIYLRNGAGVENKSLVKLPAGTFVNCYGYYSVSKAKNKWLYVDCYYNKIKYTGFVTYKHLVKQ